MFRSTIISIVVGLIVGTIIFNIIDSNSNTSELELPQIKIYSTDILEIKWYFNADEVMVKIYSTQTDLQFYCNRKTQRLLTLTDEKGNSFYTVWFKKELNSSVASITIYNCQGDTILAESSITC